MTDKIAKLKEWVDGSDNIVFFGGAGVSTESNIPDFRSVDGLESICREFDLSVPIWLDQNIADFKRIARTRFTKDSFIGESGFDYLEIQIIEED